MIESPLIKKLRFLPGKIDTLEREIEQDREELQRIRSDLLCEREYTGRLRRKESTYMSRIERNTERLIQLRLQDMQLRQKMAEAVS
jgi:hypothetical protein